MCVECSTGLGRRRKDVPNYRVWPSPRENSSPCWSGDYPDTHAAGGSTLLFCPSSMAAFSFMCSSLSSVSVLALFSLFGNRTHREIESERGREREKESEREGGADRKKAREKK